MREILYLTGTDLISHDVEMWQDGKFGIFRSEGKVIEYRKKKGKNTSNYLIRFKGTKSQGDFFDIWVRRSDFKQLN